jgi:hypothetical protein
MSCPINKLLARACHPESCVILSEASLRAQSKDLARSSARLAKAVVRERQLKGWTRSRKLELIPTKIENSGLRAEDRARSFAPAASAQDDWAA